MSPEDTDTVIGDAFLRARQARGITREQVGVEVDGISTSTLFRLEMHGILPRISALLNLARYYGISLDETLHLGREHQTRPADEQQRLLDVYAGRRERDVQRARDRRARAKKASTP